MESSNLFSRKLSPKGVSGTRAGEAGTRDRDLGFWGYPSETGFLIGC